MNPSSTPPHPAALHRAAQDLALREELLDFRRRLLAKPEARKASAYRLVRDLLVALGDDERGQQSGHLFDAWANEEGSDESDVQTSLGAQAAQQTPGAEAPVDSLCTPSDGSTSGSGIVAELSQAASSSTVVPA